MNKTESPWEWDADTNEQHVKSGNMVSDELMMMAVAAMAMRPEREGFTHDDMSCFLYGLEAMLRRHAAAVLDLTKRMEEIIKRDPELQKI